MKLVLLAAVAFCAVVVSDALCPAGQSGSSVTVCTGKPKWVRGGRGVLKNFKDAMCTPQANSDNKCITLPSGSWISGYSTGKNTCKVYRTDDCRGSSLNVTENGRFKFYEAVKSFRCNCRENETTMPPTEPDFTTQRG